MLECVRLANIYLANKSAIWQNDLIQNHSGIIERLLEMNGTGKPLSIPNWTRSENLTEVPSPEPSTHSPPYVFYLTNSALEPSYVSKNVKSLFGLSDDEFVSIKGIWNQIIPIEDHKKVFEKFGHLAKLEASQEIDFTHRILRADGMASWVSHRIKAESANGLRRFRGHLIPIAHDHFARLLDPSTISSFIHKLGNQLQLLNLAVDSLRRTSGNALEASALQETLDKTVSFVRAFSEFSQMPAWVSAFDLMEIVDNATISQRPTLTDKRIELEQEFDPAVNGLQVQGDPYLLELAIAAILQNACEATTAGGKVKLRVLVESRSGISFLARLIISDTGVGIEPRNLPKVVVPFFSTKVNRDGLGLSMAARFVELHRGTLRVTSGNGKGVIVEVILPLNRDVDEGCR